MNSLSLAITDFPTGLIILVLFIYGFMAYSLVKRLWPGVRHWINERFVWVHIHSKGWNMATCMIRAIEPVGPDEACLNVCKHCDGCYEWVNLG